MCTVVLALVSMSFINTSSSNPRFDAFVAEYKRSYVSIEEYEFRRHLFEKNAEFIANFNSEGHTWWLATNQFSDLTDEEFKNNYLGYQQTEKDSQIRGTIVAPVNIQNDEAIDWTERGFVSDVKNQGSCGSCWAFATNFGVEGAWVKYNEVKLRQKVSPPNLSEQALNDCDPKNGGCMGGLMDWAYEYYQEHCPISQNDYPYDQGDLECRREGKHCAIDKLLTYYNIESNNDVALRHALSLQPVVVGIEAENQAFRNYAGGIISGKGCGNRLNHAVGLAGEFFAEIEIDGNVTEVGVWKVKTHGAQNGG